ncbi:metallophosphoesterase (plasmid) [Novosphingobium sp. BL-8A]|uniref:metallophosphoesterase family protein n=1 Tax=Novosphingobium sp. BL-8A TaxID=3127639 RepID=UPI00375701A5
MKRSLALLVAAVLPLAGAAQIGAEPRDGVPPLPRTVKPFAGGKEEFRFAVIGDRTAGHRPEVFEDALARIDQLRPDFVINIGDLIEGKTDDRGQLDAQWTEVATATGKLGMPFFYVPGNHDLSNEVQREVWRKRLGADYYSFTYKNALFLVLNTEDPPQPAIDRVKLFAREDPHDIAKVLQALQGDPARAEELFAREPKLGALAAKVRGSENVAISDAQIGMVREALLRNPRVRWTFVLMHRPAWKVDSPAFRKIETLLTGRNYTMLAGHYHKYSYEQHGGHDYIQLGVTGGMPGGKADDPAVADHVMWVSVAAGPPTISNIRVDGFFPKEGPDQRERTH